MENNAAKNWAPCKGCMLNLDKEFNKHICKSVLEEYKNVG